MNKETSNKGIAHQNHVQAEGGVGGLQGAGPLYYILYPTPFYLSYFRTYRDHPVSDLGC